MKDDPRWVRREILKILYAEHPDWVTDELLLFTLSDRGYTVSAERLASELVYLRDWPEKDNGYVELRDEIVPRTGEPIYKSRITPRGINLVEKVSAPDPQVMAF